PIRQQRLDTGPLGISQRHTSTNDQMIRRKRPKRSGVQGSADSLTTPSSEHGEYTTTKVRRPVLAGELLRQVSVEKSGPPSGAGREEKAVCELGEFAAVAGQDQPEPGVLCSHWQRSWN
ncbi:hypothetical protein, partial [Streptomyces virginiae]|uniref:hypothetical protein n=1 Tax=Streptomyces virginiae TaxID=1961 RepID=UPI003322654B